MISGGNESFLPTPYKTSVFLSGNAWLVARSGVPDLLALFRGRQIVSISSAGEPAGSLATLQSPPKDAMINYQHRHRQETELRRLAEEKSGPSLESLEAQIPEDVRLMFHELCVHQIELEMQNEELRRTQTELDATRARYFDLYDLAPVGYCTLSGLGLILEANLTAANLLGQARGILINQPISRYIHRQDQDIYYRCQQTPDVRGTRECELRMVSANGSVFWASLASTVSRQSDGTLECRLVISNITDRKHAEAMLRQSGQCAQEAKNLLRVVLDTIPVRLFWKDLNSVFLGCNTLFAEDAGYQVPEELIGLDDTRMAWKEEAARYRRDDLEVIASGEPMQYEEVRTTPDGKQRWFSIFKVPLRDADNRIIGLLGSYEDVTRRKWSEEELLKAQKLEGLGQLAGGIAHDFNNLLMIIMGNISFAKMLTGPEEKMHARLTIAETAVLKAKDLSRQFLTFSQGGAPIKTTLAATHLIRSYGRFAMSGANTTCEYLLPDDLWNIEADEGQIGQVLTNILLNADQAMGEGGVITVMGENVEVREGDGPSLTTGRYVKITIQDRGEGIPEAIMARIFDPYFTTKESGRGLGLASAYAILRNHGGAITVGSIVGVGTTFTLFIPAATGCPETTAAAAPALSMGNKKILVMDDDDVVRNVVGGMLEEMGHQAVFAGDGQEALACYDQARQAAEPFDLVIMDLTIPGGMGGQEAIRKLLELDPQARAIVSSGYYQDPIMAEYERHGFKGVLAKPYRQPELRAQIHQVCTLG